MLSRLNKKQVFRGGGLYLGNTVLVLSVFTQSSIAHNEYFSRRDVLNVCNKISWRIIANNKIVDAKEGSWITEEKYSESIRNVIGKAIADCLTEKNEFAGKTSIEGTITFDVEPAGYSPENWNAVVLWNLIHVYNCGFKNNENYTIDEAFKTVEENVKNKYSKQIEDFDKILEKAMCDVREYAKELELAKQFSLFFKYRDLINDNKEVNVECSTVVMSPAVGIKVNQNNKFWYEEQQKKYKITDLEFECMFYEKIPSISIQLEGILYEIHGGTMKIKSMYPSDWEVFMTITSYKVIRNTDDRMVVPETDVKKLNKIKDLEVIAGNILSSTQPSLMKNQ